MANFQIGDVGAEIEFKATTFDEEVVRYGRLKVEKRVFKLSLPHIDKTKRDLLYTEFQKSKVLNFIDNNGNAYFVYWGECDRSLDGTAHPPLKPVFGIDRTNMIAGALRWSGNVIITEA